MNVCRCVHHGNRINVKEKRNHSNRAHFPLHRIVISVAFDIADIRFVLDILYKTLIDCIGFIISLISYSDDIYFCFCRNPSSCDWKETAGLSSGVLRQSSDDPATLSPLERLLGCVRSKLWLCLFAVSFSLED